MAMQGVKGPLLCLLLFLSGLDANWDEWWTYDGISGPNYWGLINPAWHMCERGRRQSPINIEPETLVYDPHLRHLHLDKHRVSGSLANTGNSVVFRLDKNAPHHVNVTGGPLVYKYRFDSLYIHFGDADGQGSEHQIAGRAFPGEIQMYGFNVDLYRNMSEARQGPNGIVGLSILMQVGETGNDELRILSSGFRNVTYRGQTWPIKHLSLAGLLPNTHHYMTYDGSTTHPGCWETTTWLLMNKPVYITRQELYALRLVTQGDVQFPKGKLANNFRPLKALHHRTVRTNIDFTNAHRSRACPSMHHEMFYAALDASPSGVQAADQFGSP